MKLHESYDVSTSSCNSTSSQCVRLFHGCAAVQSTSTYFHFNEYETTNVSRKERIWCEPPRNVNLLFRPAQGVYPYEKLEVEK